MFKSYSLCLIGKFVRFDVDVDLGDESVFLGSVYVWVELACGFGSLCGFGQCMCLESV